MTYAQLYVRAKTYEKVEQLKQDWQKPSQDAVIQELFKQAGVAHE